MLNELEQLDEYSTDMQMKPDRGDTCSDSSDIIEPSIQNVRLTRRKKNKFKRQEQVSVPLVKASSSLKKINKESIPKKCLEDHSSVSGISSLPQRRQSLSMPLIGKKLQEKYSELLFSSTSPISAIQSPLQSQLQKQRSLDSSLSRTTLNQSIPSRVNEERNLPNKLNVEIELNYEWDNLAQQNSPEKLQHKEQFSQKGQRTHSSFCREMSVSSPSKRSNNSQISDLDSEMQQMHQRISLKEQYSHSTTSGSTTINHSFKSPERNRTQNLQIDEPDAELNGFISTVNEQLKVQNFHQNTLTLQYQNISKQIQQFEWYVRDKIDRTEEYMKEKLNHFDSSNGVIVKALNDIKRTEREQRVQANEISRRRYPGFVMPKIPVSKAVSLVLLNNALKDTQYMEQFVTEISRVVTLYVYNPRKSVKSIMTKMFTLNLLVKYCWSKSSAGSGMPLFSSLTGILRAISRLLTNYMSDRDIRREMKYFFEQIPPLQKVRYF